jgi:hypothetical protein
MSIYPEFTYWQSPLEPALSNPNMIIVMKP